MASTRSFAPVRSLENRGRKLCVVTTKFLGYEISVTRKGDLLTGGQRTANGRIMLRMPRKVVQKYLDRYSEKGKIIHRVDLLSETDFCQFVEKLYSIAGYLAPASGVSGTSKSQPFTEALWRLRLAATAPGRCRVFRGAPESLGAV
jgi:hypothetical protein